MREPDRDLQAEQETQRLDSLLAEGDANARRLIGLRASGQLHISRILVLLGDGFAMGGLEPGNQSLRGDGRRGAE